MNQMPIPADLSRLKGILSNAKKIIKTDNNFQGGNLDGSKLRQNTDGYLSENNMPSNHQVSGNYTDPTRNMAHIDESAIKNSKLPDSVKQMMLNNPPQPVSLNHGLEGMEDLIEKPLPTPSAHGRGYQQPSGTHSINENVVMNNDKITVSETVLRGIIKDVLLEFLTVDYSKNLTEGVIKKTINTLIKEGKLKTKR